MLAGQVERALGENGEIPLDLRVEYTLGYIWGFLDATAQRIGLGVEDQTFVEASAYTHESLFGKTAGLEKYNESLALQQSGSEEYLSGMRQGGSEVVSWLQSGGEVQFASSEGSQSASSGKAIVSGNAPSGLCNLLTEDSSATEDSPLKESKEHECRYCHISESDLMEELKSALPEHLTFQSDVAPLEGMGVSVHHPSLPIFPIACVERDSRDSGNGPPMPKCCLSVRFPLLGALSNRPYPRPANLEECCQQILVFQKGKFGGNSSNPPRSGNSESSPGAGSSSGCLVLLAGATSLFFVGLMVVPAIFF